MYVLGDLIIVTDLGAMFKGLLTRHYSISSTFRSFEKQFPKDLPVRDIDGVQDEMKGEFPMWMEETLHGNPETQNENQQYADEEEEVSQLEC